MGLRDRLNRLEAKANWTMDDYRGLAHDAADFLAKLEDGIAVGGEIGGHRIPGNLIIDPSYRAFPGKECTFLDGPYNGKKFTLTDAQRLRRTITLKGGHVYRWDGYIFVYDGEHEETELEG